MTTKTRVPYGRALGVANLLTAMLYHESIRCPQKWDA